jgi:hypothetical protein
VALPQTQVTGKQRESSVPLIGTVVTVLVVAAALFVLFRDDGAKAPEVAAVVAPVPTPALAVAEAYESVPPRGGIAETIAEQQAPAPAPRSTIYVVASQDAAWQLTMGLAESDAVRGGMGLAPLAFRVVVLPDGVDAYAALAEEDAVAREQGLPPAEIVDLRPNADQYLQP